MVKAIDINATHEYICKEDQGKENPTIFVLGVLKKKDKMDFMSFSQTVDVEKTDLNVLMDANVKVIMTGVKKIKNIQIGDELKDIDVIDENTIEMLPSNVISEVAQVILEKNLLSEVEQKN